MQAIRGFAKTPQIIPNLCWLLGCTAAMGSGQIIFPNHRKLITAVTLATVHFQKPKWHEFCAPTLLFGVKSHQSFFFGVKPPQSLFFGVKSPQSLFFGVKSSQISFWWITVSIQNANANLHETHLSMYVLLYCFFVYILYSYWFICVYFHKYEIP